MKQTSKNWLLLLISGAALVVASILVLLKSEQVVNMLVYVAGFALFALGIALCVMAFTPSRKDERTQLLLFALGNAVLGVVIMIASDFFMLLVGLAIVLNGVGLVIEGFHLKKLGADRSTGTLLTGVGITVLGVVVAIFYKTITSALGVSIGLVMLVVGLSLLIFGFIARKNGKNQITA